MMVSGGLSKHVKTKDLQTIKCDEYSQTFACDSELKAHKKKHTQEKEWVFPNNTDHMPLVQNGT